MIYGTFPEREGLFDMKGFAIFCRTLDNLETIKRCSPPYGVVVRAGICALFTQCFEQAWRAMKEYLCREGWAEAETDMGSPRRILKIAYKAGLIQDQEGWLRALEERHLANYTYNQEVADTLIGHTKTIFLPLFRDLKRELEKRYKM